MVDLDTAEPRQPVNARIVVVLALLLVPVLPAHAQAPDTAAAIAAANEVAPAWLTLLDHGRYAETWDSAATPFRKAVAQADWKAAVTKARGPFEPFGARTLLGATFATTLPRAPAGEYVVLQYRTETAGGRAVVETITPMKDQDGRWRVAGYYIRPE